MDPFARFRQDRGILELVAACSARPGAVTASGLWGSTLAMIPALVADHLDRPLLLITADADQAEEARDDIEAALGRCPEFFPALDRRPEDLELDDELAAERLRVCLKLVSESGRCPHTLVAPIQALIQPVPTADAMRNSCRLLAVGQRLDLDQLVGWLDESYRACDQVELPGDYSRRGGIIDIFPEGHADPARIELLDDSVESIRVFDAGTQRSSQPVDEVRIPARGVAVEALSRANAHTGLTALLPPNTLLAFIEPAEVQEVGRSLWRRMGERVGLIPPDRVFQRANDFTQLYLQRFPSGADTAVAFHAGSLPQFEARTEQAVEGLAELAERGEVVVLCETAAEQRQLRELLADHGGGIERLATAVAAIHHGFRWHDCAYVPFHELLHRCRKRRTLRRVQPARPIDSFFDLKPGDLVVHVVHGIGRFRGLRSLEREGKADEYLVIEFADDAAIHVPTSQIHLVQKYIGHGGGRARLSKLGGAAWKRTKQRVADAVGDMAAELLAIQARRAADEGISYPADTRWQAEFEAAFPFTETEDQLRALAEIKRDMLQVRPMDRLICGDVGFGKTELAIRAAFKVVEYGKQVAVLVPTTVLAEQHYKTFRTRMETYPFVIEALSRFRAKPEQRKIIERARKGQVDILIGTHRLLSGDVRFADLGLVIIDEEQRFGVEAKEQLKRLRATVDVLTLSATPIPRTLHMSLLGIRDISSLATPPVDRRAIVSQVRTWDDKLIREAIQRELDRDGQVYFVHNFVRDIHTIANHLRSLLPDVPIAVGHGQMGAGELEEVMLRFVRGEARVLVSTNIIESGLDIPSANTIFINRAERFGLADLHQLRGRVGRSSRRAYCYLLLSPRHPPKENAIKRLKAIEHYSDLGAGFQIAMRDLEIRGAGNILGAEQSGHIEAVGYEMYCELLDQAVRRLRDEPADTWRAVNLDLGAQATIPKRYIRSERQRMEVYRRLAGARSTEDVSELESDLRDAFGPLPIEVRTLLQLAELRVLSQAWGVRSIVRDGPDVVFAVDDVRQCEPLFADGPGSPRVPDNQTVHWRLPRRLLEPQRLLDVLTRQLSRPRGAAEVVGDLTS